ncbi:MAG TPA: UbiD family decarboxylase, partial [Fibrobacteraceae bacterium]|nr:UbiD family decarboxylase [Fibrobacteraceae bacterium]
MIHHSLADAVKDLESAGMLRRVQAPVDPDLELPAIQQRLYQQQGPAVFFERVKGSKFPVLANLYGTLDRTRYLFRHSLDRVSSLIQVVDNPLEALYHPLNWPQWFRSGLNALPRQVRKLPVLEGSTQLSALPQIRAWPLDGGPFITLPQVCTLDPLSPSIFRSNLGMYRVQIAGNKYTRDQECGLHYQIHRGIGVHHQAAIDQKKTLRVSIFVGGPPAHALAAIMPLPEKMPELAFAGLLAGSPFRYRIHDGW